MTAEPLNASVVFFHAAGYLRIPHLIGADQADQLVKSGDARESTRSQDVTLTADRTRIDRVVSADPAFLDFATSSRLAGALRPVLGPDIELVENRHNHFSIYRRPSRDRMHRDVLQWSRSILTVLMFLSDCTSTEAATRVVPGSHLWPSTGAPNNGGTWLDQSAVYADLAEQAVSVPARAGDVLLLHGQLYHAGAGAPADGRRIVLTLAYRSADELSDQDSDHCRLISGRRAYRGRGAVHV